ncbi:MAG TPA: nuclear transport factor 2 family protein [Pyrinomonadaceae bacterium]|jgi:ketosteroid isomerase-like protein
MRIKRICAAWLALLAVAVVVVPQGREESSALSSLVAAERAFARTSVEKGIRESFLAFFAEDGINFQPHPTRTREAYLSRPAPAARPSVELNWEPIWADVSGAGDLGYTTGPYTLTDLSPEKRPARQGYYFSVWKRQADGNWKVVLDLGTQHSAPSMQKLSFHAPKAEGRGGMNGARLSLEEGRAALKDLERAFEQEAQARGFLKAFESYLTDESRLHRQQMLPLVGREAIRAYLSQKTLAVRWEPLYADIAQSGDLGYVYGSYTLTDNPARAGAIEKGYYARVWKRGRDGKWKMALDVTSPLAPEQK